MNKNDTMMGSFPTWTKIKKIILRISIYIHNVLISLGFIFTVCLLPIALENIIGLIERRDPSCFEYLPLYQPFVYIIGLFALLLLSLWLNMIIHAWGFKVSVFTFSALIIIWVWRNYDNISNPIELPIQSLLCLLLLFIVIVVATLFGPKLYGVLFACGVVNAFMLGSLTSKSYIFIFAILGLFVINSLWTNKVFSHKIITYLTVSLSIGFVVIYMFMFEAIKTEPYADMIVGSWTPILIAIVIYSALVYLYSRLLQLFITNNENLKAFTIIINYRKPNTFLIAGNLIVMVIIGLLFYHLLCTATLLASPNYWANTGQLGHYYYLPVSGEQMYDNRWSYFIVYELSGIILFVFAWFWCIVQYVEGARGKLLYPIVMLISIAVFAASEYLFARLIYPRSPIELILVLLLLVVGLPYLFHERYKLYISREGK